MRKFSDKINENNELKSYNYKMFVEIEGNLISTSESNAGEMIDKLVDVIGGADPAIVVTNYQIEEINELGQAPIDADITEVKVNESKKKSFDDDSSSDVKDFPIIKHDSRGNRIYFENSKGEWIKSEFDKNDNQIYLEDSTGYWWKTEYDSNGNEVYYENSTGYWYKKEYDSNGNQIYFESSSGYWSKSEYDSNGNEIYYENSDGKIKDNK